MSNKKTIEITVNMIQGRSAIGNDQAGKTVFDIVRGLHNRNGLSFEDPKERYAEVFPVVGTATVIHPNLMAGTTAEVRHDMYRALEKELLKHPDVVEGVYGDMLIKSDVADSYPQVKI